MQAELLAFGLMRDTNHNCTYSTVKKVKAADVQLWYAHYSKSSYFVQKFIMSFFCSSMSQNLDFCQKMLTLRLEPTTFCQKMLTLGFEPKTFFP